MYKKIVNIYQVGFTPGMQGWFGELINITHHIKEENIHMIILLI